MGDIILDLLASAPFDYYGILPIVVCCVLLFMSALVSGSEVALFSIKPTDLDALNQSNHKSRSPHCNTSQKTTRAFIDHPDIKFRNQRAPCDSC